MVSGDQGLGWCVGKLVVVVVMVVVVLVECEGSVAHVTVAWQCYICAVLLCAGDARGAQPRSHANAASFMLCAGDARGAQPRRGPRGRPHLASAHQG